MSAPPPVFRSRWLPAPDPENLRTRAGYEPTETTERVFVGSVGSTPSRLLPESTALSLPGREPERPCLRCLAGCAEGELFCRAECFETWKVAHHGRRERRYCEGEESAGLLATLPQAATNATGSGRSIPPETSPEGSAG